MQPPRNQGAVLSFSLPGSLVVVGWLGRNIGSWANPDLQNQSLVGGNWDRERVYIFHKHLQKILALTELGKPTDLGWPFYLQRGRQA